MLLCENSTCKAVKSSSIEERRTHNGVFLSRSSISIKDPGNTARPPANLLLKGWQPRNPTPQQRHFTVLPQQQ
ncbi:hypothetical protein SRHO_G00243970 [Serrasalmus rhombeus]